MAQISSAEARPKSLASARFIAQAVGACMALTLVALYLAWRWGTPALVRGIGYGSVLSLFLITSGFTAIRWSFHRPAKTFYGVVMGGMIARFTIIGICLVLVRHAAGIHLNGFVGAVLVSYVVLQILEVRFIQAELRSQSSNKGRQSTV